MGKFTHNILVKYLQLVPKGELMYLNISKVSFKLLFGQNLKVLRTKQQLSYRQLAQRCDIDYSDISKIEKGLRDIQISTVLELAKGLEIHPKELFDFDLDESIIE